MLVGDVLWGGKKKYRKFLTVFEISILSKLDLMMLI